MTGQAEEVQSCFVTTISALETGFESIIRSRPVSFVAGNSETEYVLHDGVVARLSKPLNVLVNGMLKEARDRRVEWPEVDEQTFIRFSQWAYTGIYFAADPDIVLYPSDITAALAHDTAETGDPVHMEKVVATNQSNALPAIPQDNAEKPTPYSLASCLRNALGAAPMTCSRGHAFGVVPTIDKLCDKCSRNFRVAICSQKLTPTRKLDTCGLPQYSVCVKCRERLRDSKRLLMATKFVYPTPARPFQARPNREAAEDYSEVFFSHAKLYVVADIYDITLLAKQTLHNLATTLEQFTLYKKRIRDVVILVEYVFKNTQKKDAMRDLLVHYAACFIEELNEDVDFKCTLENCPEFASALIAKMIERLD
ncbi:hypothetical protein BKA67DRAFT_134774 [Truncatella angustata]|uniref:BTB domain-containing protein n=1 Tax=Truncatella angustata TaxID=152316 RepID=A0A9P8RF31_9PEZI|nr:uncharacterized protein BKA67DRAFT_134774 [Truncatella angustata]KAH6643422.1 hypothetical protein BKA67DRAFT_134774 [Truncatella angustata]